MCTVQMNRTLISTRQFPQHTRAQQVSIFKNLIVHPNKVGLDELFTCPLFYEKFKFRIFLKEKTNTGVPLEVKRPGT